MADAWRLIPETIAREVGQKIFVIRPDGRLHILENATALALWHALERAGAQGASVAELAAELTRAFDVDPATAEQDVRSFLGALRDLGAVSVTDEK